MITTTILPQELMRSSMGKILVAKTLKQELKRARGCCSLASRRYTATTWQLPAKQTGKDILLL